MERGDEVRVLARSPERAREVLPGAVEVVRGDVVEPDTPFTCAAGARLSIPVKHTTGRYYAPPQVLDSLSAHGQILLRYAHDGNPNGSTNDIAGVRNEAGNVFGLMPHPEHAVEPLTGSGDGVPRS